MKKNTLSLKKTKKNTSHTTDRFPVLISEEAIKNRIKEIAASINKDFSNRQPVFLCLLKGAFIFFSEIVKRLTIDGEIDFMSISSYVGTESKEIKYLEKDFSHLEGREIIIVDDILDTGKTLYAVITYLKQFKPKKIHLITLLKRRGINKYKIQVLHHGFEIKDEFVIGYGLDYNEKYRNLPFISELKN